MIFGYFNSQQDFVDLVNGFLLNKKGILGIYLEGKSIELYVEDGYIKGFYAEVEDINPAKINTLSLLLYDLFSLLDHQKALFTFRTETAKGLFFQLDRSISAEELILQLQLAYQEFKSLLNLIMTPYATIRVLKPFGGMEHYDGKSFASVILTSKKPLVNEIRDLRELIHSGFLDIGQFLAPEKGRKTYEVDYVVQKVSVKNIDILSILESLRTGMFTGCISIKGAHSGYDLYFNRGKAVALYPYTHDFFDFLLNPEADSTMDVISIPKDLMEKLMLRHSKLKLIDGLSHDLVELGKIFIGIAKTKFSGLLTLHKGNEKMHFVYKKGVLLASLLEDDQLKIVREEPYMDGFLLDLIPFEPMENFSEVLHLLLINTVYGIILRHNSQAVQSIYYHLATSDLFKVVEGSIYFRKDPKGNQKETLDFLSFLLDLGYKALGKEKLEEELENSLHPYKDIFKALEIEDYIKR